MKYLLAGVGILACILALTAGIIAAAPYVAMIIVAAVIAKAVLSGNKEIPTSRDGEDVNRLDHPDK